MPIRYKDEDPVVYKDAQELKSDDNIEIPGKYERVELLIYKATEADSGRYWCIAETDRGPVKLLCVVYISGTVKFNQEPH